MNFERILVQLTQSQIKYVLVGGLAVNLHGFPRQTADIDVMLAMDFENVLKFVEVIKRMGWRPRTPVPLEALADAAQRENWIQEKGMKAFTVYDPQNPIENLDVLIDAPLSFDEAYKNSQKFVLGPVQVTVASIDDLIRMKKHAGRVRDLNDIEALLQLKEIENEQQQQ